MRSPCSFLFLVLVAGSAIVPGSARGQTESSLPPHSADDLVQRYQKAHNDKNAAAVSQLFYWGNANAQTRKQVQRFIVRDIARPTRSVAIKRLSGDQATTYTQHGIRYHMTLDPVARLEIEFAPRTVSGASMSSEITTYAVGFHQGAYYLITAEPMP
jgi:hypothetical protein